MALSREWASLHEIVTAAIGAVRTLFDSKGLYLDADVPADLAPLFCDSTRVHQVVLNLLGNAGRLTECGGVRIRAWQEQDEIVVSVADTGPGIAPEDQARLFEPFQQLDAFIRRRHGGSGLGLCISRRFVEMHGGRMWLESKPGVGTVFFFALPLATATAVAVSEGNSALRWINPYSEHEYRLRTRRSMAPPPEVVPRYVLLEEEGALQRLFGRYLDGVELALAEEPSQALVELDRSPAQALIVNAPPSEQLPPPLDKPGALPYGTPAIACWVPGEDEAARRLGVVRYLVKPISRETLLSTLDQLDLQIRTILLVDDEPEARQLFTRILTSAERG